MRLLRIITMAGVVVLGLCMSQAAFADSIWSLGPNLSADASFSASGGSWSLTMTFTNSGSAAETVNQFTLDLFAASNVAPPTFAVTSSSTNGWGYAIDGKASNSGTSTCGSLVGTNKGWLCVAGTSPSPLSIAPGTPLVFTLSGTYLTSPLDPNTLDLISNGIDGGDKWAISAPAGSTVPEPASIGLLGIGMGALGLFWSRKLRRDDVVLPSKLAS